MLDQRTDSIRLAIAGLKPQSINQPSKKPRWSPASKMIDILRVYEELIKW